MDGLCLAVYSGSVLVVMPSLAVSSTCCGCMVSLCVDHCGQSIIST